MAQSKENKQANPSTKPTYGSLVASAPTQQEVPTFTLNAHHTGNKLLESIYM